ncbi:MAG: alpha/beta hydrolase [Pseudomonadota bacterium]
MTLTGTLTTISVRGVDVSFYEAGSGPAVLYLHGAATLEGFSFLDALTDDFQVIAPFHPGYAPGQEGRGLLGAQDLTVHYMDFIETLQLDRPHLIGFSMGGWLAAELAVFYGGRLGGVALIAPAGLRTDNIPCTDLGAIAPVDLPSYLAHDASIAARYFPGGDAAPAESVFEADRAREAAAQALIEAPVGMGHPNMGRWLHRIKNPVKVYWGAEDRMVSSAYLHRWAAAIPHADQQMIEKAGHLVMFERPGMMDDVVDFFWRSGVKAEQLK